MQEARAATADQNAAHYQMLLGNKGEEVAAFKEAKQRRQEALAQASVPDITPEEREWLDQLEAAGTDFDNNFLNVVVPAWQAGDPATLSAAEKTSDQIFATVRSLTDRLISDFQARSQQAHESADTAAAASRTYLFFAALVGIGLSMVVALVAASRLNRPLKELKAASDAMSRGDLDRRVRITTNDEIADLGRSFNRMAEAIQHKIRQLTRLSDIALAVSSEFDWEYVVNTIMEKGMELTDSQAAAIVLYDEERRTFTDTYTKGLSDNFVSKMQFRPGGLAEEVLLGDHAVFSDDIRAKHRLSNLARSEGIRAFICLPLKVGQKKLGVFYVYSKEVEAYTREELSVLSILSSQAAIAIQNAQRFERSREEAVTDGLTGLYNQRYFYSRLKEEIERAARNKKPLSVIFCDLDKFKVFNDLNGHALGDQALKEVARIIAESKRAIDVAARYGGEEFALILPDTDSSGAQIIAHRIRRRVAGFVFKTKARASARHSPPA